MVSTLSCMYFAEGLNYIQSLLSSVRQSRGPAHRLFESTSYCHFSIDKKEADVMIFTLFMLYGYSLLLLLLLLLSFIYFQCIN
jgi:hypothetical protein